MIINRGSDEGGEEAADGANNGPSLMDELGDCYPQEDMRASLSKLPGSFIGSQLFFGDAEYARSQISSPDKLSIAQSSVYST